MTDNVIPQLLRFNNLKIGSRLVLLILASVLILVITGGTALVGLNFAADTTAELNRNVSNQVNLSQLSESVQGDILGTINDVYRGVITWDEATDRLAQAKAGFNQYWRDYQAGVDSGVEQLSSGLEGLKEAFTELEGLLAKRDRANLSLFVLNDLDGLVEPFLGALHEAVADQQARSEQAFQSSRATSLFFLYASVAIILGGMVVSAGLGFVIFKSISVPIVDISNTVRKVSEGDYTARTDVPGRDELGELAKAFNTLLEEKVASLVQAERESEALNNSVINLIKSVSQLAQQRDLTVKVPVSEDITGAIGDSLNLLARETSSILLGVRDITHKVAEVSNRVKQQSDMVLAVADTERTEVITTAKFLKDSVSAMHQIAEDAQSANHQAEDTLKNTQEAVDTVLRSVEGINSIRDTISETEKRIKRLGERSQEITGIVNLINSIAERTHILALNASMHAASAGEAGRGFAVVADEVQRLAENAREATAQISTLVNNIRVETADTVTTMNTAISQVAEGTRLAQQAGESMRQTQRATNELVGAVQHIASSSLTQSEASNALLDRARQIQESTEKTGTHLNEQTKNTDALVRFSNKLVQAIGVFKLPEAMTQKLDDTLDVAAMKSVREAG